MTPSRRDVQLPPVAPEVFAFAVEGLTTRLRGRLDAAVEALAAAPVTAEDGTFRVRCGEDASVTLTPGPSGAVTDAEQARCGCLLAPRCLHRAAVLGTCPVADVALPTDADRSGGVGLPADADRSGGVGRSVGVDLPVDADRPGDAGRSGDSGRPDPSVGQVRAAAGLWDVAAGVLSAGTAGAGAVVRAELLRAAHTARLAGLHRAEAAALDVVRLLRDAGDSYGPRSLTELAAVLRELLLVTRRLKAGDPDPALLGSVRRNHHPDGPLRLYGVCREPVIGPDGLGGVVTHLVDDDGRWYTLRDVKPGGPDRARRAGTAHVAVRSFLSDHFRLSRGGLILSGAVVAPDGRLLPEQGVRATFAAGRPWTDAGDAGPLTSCDVEIVAADGEDLLVRVRSGRPTPGPPVRLAPAHRHPGLAHAANLRRLGAHPGLRIRVLGRVDPERATTLRPLAVGATPGTEATLRLPDEWQGRADLGYDRLDGAHFPPDLAAPCAPAPSDARAAPASAPAPAPAPDSPLWRVRGPVEAAVAGGRRAAAEPARDDDRHGHLAALRHAGFGTGAELLARLGAVAARRTRDAFGRLDGGDRDQYAAQWLAAAVYLAAAEEALRRETWSG